MVKTVIIDDEVNSRELLFTLLTDHCDNVEILGMGKDVKSGIEIIQQKEPQLVLLDIEMPGGNGFDILNAFEKIDFKVIFITGYDHYAIKAIKYAALDYILKPVDLEELKTAIEKVTPVVPSQNSQLKFLQSSIDDTSKKLDKIIISSHNNKNIVGLQDILYLEAMDGYSLVYTAPDVKHVSTHSLAYFEDLLPINQFFRVHKSHLINCNKVTSFDAGRGGNVFLQEGIRLPIATRRKPLFVSFMNRLNK